MPPSVPGAGVNDAAPPSLAPAGQYCNKGTDDLLLEVELRPDHTLRASRCLVDLWARPRTEVVVHEGRWSLSGDELEILIDGVALRYRYSEAVTVPSSGIMPDVSVPGWEPVGEQRGAPIDHVPLISSDAYSRAWRAGLVASHEALGWKARVGPDRIEFTRPARKPWWKFW